MQLPFDSFDTGEAPSVRPIRVLHCIPTLAVGGAETQLRLLAPRLAARGISVAIFSRFADGDVKALTTDGVTCFPLNSTSNYDPSIIFALHGAVRRFRPAIIQTWLTQMDIVGGVAARAFGIPWIISERSSPPGYPPILKNKLRQWLGRRATICANAQHGLDVWPRNADRDVISNGIDLAAVAAVSQSIHAHAGSLRDTVDVITVSRLAPEKCVDVLIAAIALARSHVPNIRLVVVGDGPERGGLEALAAENDLADHVVFTGFQSSPIEWMRSAHMFASASRFEGHPNAVTEAAAAGIPTILSDIVMHRTLMGNAARYAAPHDASSFANHFIDLSKNYESRNAIAKAARQAVGRFDIDAITSRYIELYQRLTLSAAFETEHSGSLK